MDLTKVYASETKYVVQRGRVIPAKIRLTPNGRKLAYLQDCNSWRDYGIRVSRTFNNELLAYLDLESTQNRVIQDYTERLAETRIKIKQLRSTEK